MRAMAARSQLVLSDDELAGIVRLVNETGNFAPERVVVEWFGSGSLIETPAHRSGLRSIRGIREA